MKKIIIFLLTLISLSTAFAEIKSLEDVMAKATEEDVEDLAKFLKQIQLVPVKMQDGNTQIMKVVRVDKGSVYEREGIKVGDLVSQKSNSHVIQEKTRPAKTVDTPQKAMEMYQHVKTQDHKK